MGKKEKLVDLKPKVDKISDEHLKEMQDIVNAINSIQFRIKFWHAQSSLSNVLRINDINICYRSYREISVNEDD